MSSGPIWCGCCRGRRAWALPRRHRRQLIDGIGWRARTGSPWRDVPGSYGRWQTIYGLFRRWQRDGTWAQVVTRLQAAADAAGRICWQLSVDSTVCRAHQHAAGARRDGSAQREPPGGTRAEPDDRGLGRSRGGFSTKVHLACEQGQKPLAVIVTAGQRGDAPQFTAVMEAIAVPRPLGRPRTRPDRVLADRAYASRAIRSWLRRHGSRPPSPSPRTRSATGPAADRPGGSRARLQPGTLQGPARGGVRDQPGRKRHRAIATRYDKLAVRYEAMLHVVLGPNGLRPARPCHPENPGTATAREPNGCAAPPTLKPATTSTIPPKPSSGT